MKIYDKKLACPYFVWMVLFTVVPLFIVVYYALTDSTGSFTLDNLQTLLLQQILLLLERSTEDFFCMSDCLLITLALLHRDITARLANLGSTSAVTQFLNFTAVESLEPRTKA